MKRIKMLLYGEPGVGKSVFANSAPNRYFITTDGNYEWLEEFGAKAKDHAQVSSFAEAKKILGSDMIKKYDTIVIDLLEDLFKWCEYEYCARNRIEHVSDVGYGKGYDTSRNEFFIEICKLLAMDKNVILIMHGDMSVVKDRRGVEHQQYAPSSRLPAKLLDMIEGRVRYCLRCYLKDEEQDDGTLIKKRYLSLIPKPNEYGIVRGIDESKVPHDIPLDFKEFAKVIGLDVAETVDCDIENDEDEIKDAPAPIPAPKRSVSKPKVKAEEKVETAVPNADVVKEPEVKTEIPAEKAEPELEQTVMDLNEPETEPETESVVVDPKNVQAAPVEPTTVAEVKDEPKPAAKTELSNNDKLEAIKAKLAAINAAKNK